MDRRSDKLEKGAKGLMRSSMTAAIRSLRGPGLPAGASAPPEAILERVRAHLWTQLERGTPSLAQVAKQLAYGERTLQRHLRRLDTSFVELLTEVRRERYEALTKADHPSDEELAQALGYSDARSLRRWRQGSMTRSPKRA